MVYLRKDESVDLHDILSNHVSEIVYISGERVTWRVHVLVVWGTLVTATWWIFKWWPISRIVSTGQAKVD